MNALIFLLVSFTCAAAASNDGCVVGQWGPWGECKRSAGVQSQGRKTFSAASSYPLPEAEWDSGRVVMETMMRQKQAHWAELDKCTTEGTCPEHFSRPSQGAATCVNGFVGDLPCRNIDQLSFHNIDDLGYVVPAPGERKREVNDIWGWSDPETGDEYAIVAMTGGTSFVRVTDPERPVTVGFLYTTTTAVIWRDVKTIGDYAYIVAESPDHGMQIVDMTRFRGSSTLTYIEADAFYGGFGNAHNIIENVETGFVYVVGANKGNYDLCRGGLYVVDVNEPLNPKFAGCFGDDGYVHDAQCLNYRGPDLDHYGSELCFCYNEDSLTLVDVTDKNNMKLVSKRGYDGHEYTHQGWLTEDQTIVLLDDELDESRTFDKYTKTYVWDVTDLDNPVLKSTFRSAETSIDHNQYVLGDLTYQANYEAGLRILHIKQEQYTLEEMAYFDVFPSSTTANFNGAWSVYPYFESGNLIVSSIDYGLYVLRPRYDAIRDEIEAEQTYGERTRFRNVISADKSATMPQLQETQAC